jgi:membrane fusion protein (multidrug efflux system)
VAPAVEETVDHTVSVVASLEARNDVTLLSEINSTVDEIMFSEGQEVNQSDVLIRLNEVQPKARLEEAKSNFALAELTYKRSQSLLESQTISQEAFDESQADYFNRKANLALAEDEQAKTTITAPFDGKVGEREVSVGQVVSPGLMLATLTQVDPLEAVADIPERFLRHLKEGLEARFIPNAYPDDPLAATVTYVAPVVDTDSRTVRIKAEVTAGELIIKPGMFGVLELVLERRKASLVIPESAVQFSGDATSLVAINGEGRTEFRNVKLGERFKGRVEVIEGLAAGELVVVEGHQKMGPGMLVMAAPESAVYGLEPGPLGNPPPAGEAAGEAR